MTERALYRHTDPITSAAAARSIEGELPKLEATVLKALAAAPNGATSEELAKELGLSLVTVSPRLRPLADKGLVIASDARRKGASGRAKIVWRICRREPTQPSLL